MPASDMPPEDRPVSKSFRCKVVTPDAQLLDSDVAYASVPAWDGSFGVLPRRAPILAKLGTGELTLRFPDGDGGERSFFIDGGFAKMADDELVIVAEHAVPAEQLSESDIEAELKEAEARTVPEDAEHGVAEQAKVRNAVQAAKVKLRIAKAVRARGI